jgi:hypothetical protein
VRELTCPGMFALPRKTTGRIIHEPIPRHAPPRHRTDPAAMSFAVSENSIPLVVGVDQAAFHIRLRAP